MAGGVEFPYGLEPGLRAEGGPGIVAGEQGLEFADDLLGGGFRDQVALDLELEALLEERGNTNGIKPLFSPVQEPLERGHGPSGCRARRQGKPRAHARAGWKSPP